MLLGQPTKVAREISLLCHEAYKVEVAQKIITQLNLLLHKTAKILNSIQKCL